MNSESPENTPENTPEHKHVNSSETTEPSVEVLLHELHEDLLAPIVIEGEKGRRILDYIRSRRTEDK